MRKSFHRVPAGFSSAPTPRVVIRSDFAAALLVVALSGASLFGGVVTGVRLGLHPDHTRVVFDCRGAVRTGDPFVDPRGIVLLPFPEAGLDPAVGPEPARGYAVTAVEFIEWPSMPVARIQLGVPLEKVRVFRLSSPDRVVVDLFTEGEEVLGTVSGFQAALAGESVVPSAPPPGGGRDRLVPGAFREASAGTSIPGLAAWSFARPERAVLLAAIVLSGATLLLLWSCNRRGRELGQPARVEAELPLDRLREIDALIGEELVKLERLSGRSRPDDG